MLVFIGNSEDTMRAGAVAAAAAGFQRTAILQGGLPAFARSATNQVGPYHVSYYGTMQRCGYVY